MNDEQLTAKIDTLIDINRESQQWLKILAWDSARDVVETSLDDAAEYHLYEELDGGTSIGKVLEEVPVPQRTAYRRLDEWQQVGIVSKVGRGKYRKIAGLEDLGIELPELEADDGEE